MHSYHETLQRGNAELFGRHCYPINLHEPSEEHPTFRERPHVMLFHLAVWLAGNEVNDFMVCSKLPTNSSMVNLQECEKIVVFGKREDRDAFLRWRKRYSSWFVNAPMIRDFVPDMPRSGSHRIHLVEFSLSKEDNPGYEPEYTIPRFFEAWSWIAHHCRRPVWRYWAQGGGAFAFKDATEAVEFKLKFT